MRLTAGVTSFFSTAYWPVPESMAPNSVASMSSTGASSLATAAAPVAPTGLPSIWWQLSPVCLVQVVGVKACASSGLPMMVYRSTLCARIEPFVSMILPRLAFNITVMVRLCAAACAMLLPLTSWTLANWIRHAVPISARMTPIAMVFVTSFLWKRAYVLRKGFTERRLRLADSHSDQSSRHLFEVPCPFPRLCLAERLQARQAWSDHLPRLASNG